MAIPDEDVARVRAATDVVALVGEHTALKRQGRRWVGLCPFHQEKTPSFSVNAEEGVYYCFGCHRSGDVITFVRDVEHVDFVEAVRRLAERAGIAITEDAAASAEHRHRQALLAAVERAVAWYHERLLHAPDAGPARDYLRSRGYDGEVVRRFSLGWAPDEWDALARHLQVPDAVLSGSGLGFVNRRGRQQDAFRGRVMFPIFDPSGRPIAFGGRVLPPRPGAPAGAATGPKYKNSPDGPLYAKRRTLYGLNWAKHDVVASGEVVVCEGYTDVIGCFLAGVPRAVATCGTALGEEHFRLLANFARRIVLAYDADPAGQAGASRIHEWERHHDVDVAVAVLPPGTDPGELARSDPEALRRAVAEARPFLAFLVDRVLQAADLHSAEGRARAAEAALAVVAEHPSELVRDQYALAIADRCRLEPAVVRQVAERLHGAARRGAQAAPALRAARRGLQAGTRSATGLAGRPGTAGGGRAAGSGHIGAGPAGVRWAEDDRAGLEALRLAVHRPELVAHRLEPVLFADPRQRAVFEVLAEADSLPQALALADERGADVADLLRRVVVEEPADDVDGVVVQLVRVAGHRALADLERQARLEPAAVARLAPEIALVKRCLEDMEDRRLGVGSAERLLAWLLGTDQEG